MNLDTTCPDIPLDIFNLAGDDADLTYSMRCDELWAAVVEEVREVEYERRLHHNVGTYDVGCRGPLCKKAHREHPKRRSPNTSVNQLREDRIYDPVLEYFHVVIKHRIKNTRQEILAQLKEHSA